LLFVIASKGRSSRQIPLNTTAVATLREMYQSGNLPFPLKDFRKRWWRALRSANISNFTFHDLRKEFASELIRKNVNPNIIQKLFAHSDMSITNVYMHSEMDQLKQAVNTLDDNVQELRGEQ
jgi:integrase